MKKLLFTLVVGLMLPVGAFAQSLTQFQVNQLLQEDISTLVALNGQAAVEQYLQEIITLLSNEIYFVVNQPREAVPPYTAVSGNPNSNDVDVDTNSATDIEDDEVELRGEITGGDDVRVWFVISRTDRTPSCFSSSQRESVSSRYDEGDDFKKVVDDLREDTRYYFRACAENEDGNTISGAIKNFRTDDERDEDKPEVETGSVRDIRDDSAELRGSVDMNDFRNGIVFFVWGEDEDNIDEVEEENEYSDISEDGEDLQKKRVDSDLDRDEDYRLDVDDLDEDTRHYFRLCVEYEDEDNDEVLECGDVEDFRTED